MFTHFFVIVLLYQLIYFIIVLLRGTKIRTHINDQLPSFDLILYCFAVVTKMDTIFKMTKTSKIQTIFMKFSYIVLGVELSDVKMVKYCCSNHNSFKRIPTDFNFVTI